LGNELPPTELTMFRFPNCALRRGHRAPPFVTPRYRRTIRGPFWPHLHRPLRQCICSRWPAHYECVFWESLTFRGISRVSEPQ